MLPRHRSGEDRGIAGGAIPEDGIQWALEGQLVIEERVLLHELPSEGVDEDDDGEGFCLASRALCHCVLSSSWSRKGRLRRSVPSRCTVVQGKRCARLPRAKAY